MILAGEGSWGELARSYQVMQGGPAEGNFGETRHPPWWSWRQPASPQGQLQGPHPSRAQNGLRLGLTKVGKGLCVCFANDSMGLSPSVELAPLEDKGTEPRSVVG